MHPYQTYLIVMVVGQPLGRLVDFLDWIDGGLEFFFGLPIKFEMFFGIQIVEYAVSI